MSPLLVRRLALSSVLLVFAFYSLFLTPGREGPAAWRILLGSMRNPAVLAVFGLLVIETLMYWAQLSIDSVRQKIIAWPFAIAMMPIGALSLLAYLILRGTPAISDRRSIGLPFRLVASRRCACLLLAVLIALLALAVWQGDWLAFIRDFRTIGLINLATVNLVLLILLFPVLLPDDFDRRGLNEEGLLPRIAMAVPLLGPALYLALRPGEASSQPTRILNRRQ